MQILGTSTVNITWVIEDGTPGTSRLCLSVRQRTDRVVAAGTYRITYFGDYKPVIGSITPFVGHSSNFTISA